MFDNQGKNKVFRNVLYRVFDTMVIWISINKSRQIGVMIVLQTLEKNALTVDVRIIAKCFYIGVLLIRLFGYPPLFTDSLEIDLITRSDLVR